MTSDSNKVPICMLDETNWSIWKVKTLAYARANKIAKLLDKNIGLSTSRFKSKVKYFNHKNTIADTEKVESTTEELESKIDIVEGFTLEKFNESNDLLFLRLITTIKDSILYEFININTGSALELWEELLHKYESEPTANARQLLSNILNMKKGSKTVGVYMAQMLDLCRRLERIVDETGINIIEVLTTNQMVIGLDSKFNLFKETILSDDANLMDIRACMKIISTRSERLQLDSIKGIISNNNLTSGTALQVVTSNKNDRCNHCHKSGHLEVNCYHKYPEKKPGYNFNNNNNNHKEISKLPLNTNQSVVNQMKPKKNFKKVNRIKSELMNDSDDMNLRNHHYSKGSSTTTTSSGNYPSVWSVKSVKSVQQYDEEVGHITFTVDSGADVTVKHGNGVGLNNFKPDISIDLEVADQRLVQTKGMGEITGKISNIHVAPTFGTSLLSVYQMYKEGKAVLFHPTA